MPLIKHLLKEYSSIQRGEILSDSNFRFGIEVEFNILSPEWMEDDSLPNPFKEFEKAYDGQIPINVTSDGATIVELINKELLDSVDKVITLYEDVKKTGEQLKDIIEPSDKHSAHINISYDSGQTPNPIKGLLFLNHDFAKKYLRDSLFAQDIIQYIKYPMQKFVKQYNKRLSEESGNGMITIGDIIRHEDFTTLLNRELLKQVNNNFAKQIGLNIGKLESDNPYMEFRYPSSEVDSNDLEERIVYYAHLTKLVFDDNYMKEQYYKRLFKMVNDYIQAETD